MSQQERFSGGAAAHVVASLVACHVSAMVHPAVSAARPDQDGDGVPCPGEIRVVWSMGAEISPSCMAHDGMPCLTVLAIFSSLMPKGSVLILATSHVTLLVLYGVTRPISSCRVVHYARATPGTDEGWSPEPLSLSYLPGSIDQAGHLSACCCFAALQTTRSGFLRSC